MSIELLNGQNLTVISEHYGHSAKILGYGYCSTGPISIGLLSLQTTHDREYIGSGVYDDIAGGCRFACNIITRYQRDDFVCFPDFPEIKG